MDDPRELFKSLAKSLPGDNAALMNSSVDYIMENPPRPDETFDDFMKRVASKLHGDILGDIASQN